MVGSCQVRGKGPVVRKVAAGWAIRARSIKLAIVERSSASVRAGNFLDLD
jgi:hypothetical protein